jgi:hypothetical protein
LASLYSQEDLSLQGYTLHTFFFEVTFHLFVIRSSKADPPLDTGQVVEVPGHQREGSSLQKTLGNWTQNTRNPKSKQPLSTWQQHAETIANRHTLRPHTQAHICMHARTHACMHKHVHTCRNTLAQTNTHTHTHTHTHAHKYPKGG